MDGENITMQHAELPASLNALSYDVIGAALEVHKALGPGLLERAYQLCMEAALHARGLRFRAEVLLPVSFRGRTLDGGYRMDFLVEDALVMELKAVDELTSLHKAQLRTYLKLSRRKLGLLINFNVEHLRDGIHREIHSAAAP